MRPLIVGTGPKPSSNVQNRVHYDGTPEGTIRVMRDRSQWVLHPWKWFPKVKNPLGPVAHHSDGPFGRSIRMHPVLSVASRFRTCSNNERPHATGGRGGYITYRPPPAVGSPSSPFLKGREQGSESDKVSKVSKSVTAGRPWGTRRRNRDQKVQKCPRTSHLQVLAGPGRCLHAQDVSLVHLRGQHGTSRGGARWI